MKLLALLLFLFCLHANAGIYIEPYAGYVSQKYDIKGSGTLSGTPFTIDDTDSDSGVGFGGKLGYSIPLLAIGADYMQAGDVSDLGPFLEVRLPLFLKFRTTYIMASKTKTDDDEFKFKGTGFKAGLAFSLFLNLTLNVDYISVKYDKLDGNISGYDFDSIDVKRNAYMVSLGFPFDI